MLKVVTIFGGGCMPIKKKGKSKTKKAASRKSAKKSASKKVLKKKSPPGKKAAKKKTTKKKTLEKKAAKKKTAKKKAPVRPKPSSGTAIPPKTILVEPGPPPRPLPPLEEPAQNEEAIGTVTHYYSHLGVAVIQVNKGTLRSGDTIHVKGHTTDFTQKIQSMEYEHQHVDQAGAGQSIGIKIVDHAREHDIVYRVK
jgi:translation elongation factor EF-G